MAILLNHKQGAAKGTVKSCFYGGRLSLSRPFFIRTSKLSKTIYSRLVIAMDLADDIRAQKEIQVQFLDLVILINDASSCS